MRISRTISVVILLFIFTIFLIGLNKSQLYDTTNLTGQTLTTFKMKSFQEDEVISNKNLYSNEFTLINFWGSWCLPCREEHSTLMALSKIKKIKIMGVNFKDNELNAINFLKTLGDPYDIKTIDKDGKHSVNFGIYGIPESILVDNDLKIIAKFVGPLSKKNFDEIINIIK